MKYKLFNVLMALILAASILGTSAHNVAASKSVDVKTASITPTITDNAPLAAANCQCVDYIKNTYGIKESTGNAKDMGTWLSNHGFERVYKPEKGAVAVMQPYFPGLTSTASNTYGHVGIIREVADWGTQWKISLRGANQGGTNTEYGCNNVNTLSWRAYAKTDTRISYYRIKQYAVKSLQSPNLYWGTNGTSLSSYTPLKGYTYTGYKDQLFYFIKYGSSYKIIIRSSGMCIRPSGTSKRASLVQRTCNNESIEKWTITTNSDGTVVLKNSSTGYVADLDYGLSIPGTAIIIYPSHGGNNQKWIRENKPY